MTAAIQRQPILCRKPFTDTKTLTLHKIKIKINGKIKKIQKKTGKLIKDNIGLSDESMSPKNNGIYSKKSIFILGDRMLRHIQDWDITKAINNEQGGGGGG